MTRALKDWAATVAALLATPVVAAVLIGVLMVAGYAVLILLCFHEIRDLLRHLLGVAVKETDPCPDCPEP